MHQDEKEDGVSNEMMGSTVENNGGWLPVPHWQRCAFLLSRFPFPVLLLLFVASCAHGRRGEVASDNALNLDIEEVCTCWYCRAEKQGKQRSEC